MKQSSRTKLFAGNWKMYKSVQESITFLNEFSQLVRTKKLNVQEDVEFAILAQSPLLHPMQAEWEMKIKPKFLDVKGVSLSFGAQNAYWQKDGAYTGELSPALAKEIGCNFILSGHSERRQFFGETNETAAKRAKAAHDFGMRAIFCVGENLKEREQGAMFSVLEAQCCALTEIVPTMPKGFVLAYEPVWAIGTGKNASAEEAESAHQFLREFFEKKWGKEAAEELQILYGGSVKPQNSSDLLACKNIDGVLVGGASLDAKNFFEIAQSAK